MQNYRDDRQQRYNRYNCSDDTCNRLSVDGASIGYGFA